MKVAFITPRYGESINGGAELQARLTAHHLKDSWDIEVLSTCALDYRTWKNHFSPGDEVIEEIKVKRFEVDYERSPETFDLCYDFLVKLYLYKQRKAHITTQDPMSVEHLFSESKDSLKNPILKSFINNSIESVENIWMKLQGPYSTSLVDYLESHKDTYDLFVFFTANYALTYYGLPKVRNKAILVPELHREACMSFNIFDQFFNIPKYFIFNTEEEKFLAKDLFPQISNAYIDVAGIGLDRTKNPIINKDDLSFELDFNFPYILYLGRIEQSKGCDELLHNFLSYKSMFPKSELKLVFAGKKFCEMKEHQDVIYTGFVSENQKDILIENAKIFVMPSPYESFSIALLEAWSFNIPTLVNGKSDVLKGHCKRSGGGFYYNSHSHFVYLLDLLFNRPYLSKEMGAKGSNYVKNNYKWKNITGKYLKCAEQILQANLPKESHLDQRI